MTTRSYEAAHLPQITSIYNHYVARSHVTFDLEPRTESEATAWASRYAETGPNRLLVAAVEGSVVAYASSQPYRPKAAYATSVELSLYVHHESRRRGVGRRLLATLIDQLDAEPLAHRAYGLVALPNDASIRLLNEFGFREVGITREVGRKFDQFWDVAIWERQL